MATSISILEMNGERIERSLNYIPSNRGYYNVVVKGEKLVKANTAEDALKAAQDFATKGFEHIYIKVPSGLKSVELSNLRIA